MIQLPICHMTLYKHGVGFFERRAKFTGDQVELSFRVDEMNDILKSLTAIELDQGKVLGIDYATPQSKEERLEGCSIRLGDLRSLQDLITGLRGRNICALLDQGETFVGRLVGLDQVAKEQAISTSLVSIFIEDENIVKTVPLGRLQGLTILDERGANDLRFFLQTSLSQENYRQVTIRLTPGEHELSISYIAPAPTWRVSYRLVVDTQSKKKSALLMGWGIFDNRLEEDLHEISLSLVAGMPISFIYDLYTPFTPERPEVKEEARIATGPIEFEPPTQGAAYLPAPAPSMAFAMADAAPHAPARMRSSMKALEESAEVNVSSKDLGELFQYLIQTPVTVGRGQSAMVPILSTRLDFHKDLLYNGQKLARHPVATLRLKNTSGLSLERGPVTVLESREYVGEAVLPFTAAGNEIVVPYAVELGVKVSEAHTTQEEIHALRIQAGYLLIEVWEALWCTYQLTNTTSKRLKILIEHQRRLKYDLYDSPDPQEKTEEQYRFEVDVPAHGETQLHIKERRLVARREDLRRQSLEALSRFVKQGFLDPKTYNKVAELLRMWEQITDLEKQLTEIEKSREKIFKAQQQIQGNMKALGSTGKEGELRARYVAELESSEEHLKQLHVNEEQTKREIKDIENFIKEKISALS